MRILGIDPGLKVTGYGFVENNSNQPVRLLEAGIIQPKAKENLPARIHKIYSTLNDLSERYRPNVLVLEKLYAHYRHPTTASILGHVRGVICLLSAEKEILLAEHSVKRIRKALTGNGNASKQQTLRVVAQRLHLAEENLTLDASDALALALGYIDIDHKKIVFSRFHSWTKSE